MKKLLLALALLPTLAFGITKTEQSDMEFKGKVNLGSEISATPATSTATGNVDALPTTGIYQLRLTGAAPTIRGIANGYAGKELLLINATGADQLIKNNDTAATAANRILTGTGDDLEFPQDAAFRLVYDMVSARWRIAGGGGAGGTEILAVPPIEYDPDTTELSIPPATNAADGYMPKEQVQAIESHEGRLDAAEPAIVAAQGDATAAGVAIAGHLSDPTDAHAGAAIGNTPSGNVSSTNVQNAINELQADIDTRIADPSGKQNGLSLQTESGAAQWRAQAQRKNWLSNESFEYGTATNGWTTSAATFAADTGTKIYGAQSMKMTFVSGAGSISQSVTPPTDYQGQSVQHTAWVKTTDTNIDVCALRSGVVYECKKAPADGLWHEVGFIYKDPGTGTRGISISRASGGASDTWIDGVYVGPYEPNVPAVINVGGTWIGRVTVAATSGCDWQNSSGSYAVASAAGSCPTATPHPKGAATAPATKVPGATISVEAGDSYTFVLTGDFGLNGNNARCSWRMSDGTDSSEAGTAAQAGNLQIRIPTMQFSVVPSSSGVKQYNLQSKLLSGTSCDIYNSLTDQGNFTIDVYRQRADSKLAGTIITDEPWYYLSSKMTTRVTSTPSKEGEYRVKYKAVNSQSYDAWTDTAPSVAPSSVNGMLVYPDPYDTAGTSGEANAWEIFVGKNLTVAPEFYESTGRSGQISAEFWVSDTTSVGCQQNYNPVSGNLFVNCGTSPAGTNNALAGVGKAGFVSGAIYFDVKVFNNPLAAGMKTTEDIVTSYAYNGYASTNTMIPRFVNSNAKGDAITYADSSTAGASYTINKDGLYMMHHAVDQQSSSGGSGTGFEVGISLNSSQLTTSIDSITATNLLAIGYGRYNYSDAANVTAFRYLRKGDVVRPHNGGTNKPQGSSSVFQRFTIAKVPSPFEVAGAMPGGASKLRTISFAFGGATEGTNTCSTSPCTIYRQMDDDGNTDSVSSVTRGSTGNYLLNLKSGVCSSEIISCAGTSNNSNRSVSIEWSNVSINTPTSTQYGFRLNDASGASTVDGGAYMTCTCRK